MRNSPYGALWKHVSEGGIFHQTERCSNDFCKKFIEKQFKSSELNLANSNHSLNQNFTLIFDTGYELVCRICQGALYISNYYPGSETWFLNVNLEGANFSVQDTLSAKKVIQFEDSSFSLAGVVIYDVKRGECLTYVMN